MEVVVSETAEITTQAAPLLESAEDHHKKVSPQGQGSARDAYEAGRALIAAKEATPRNGWLVALRTHTSINPRSCQRYMLLARAVDNDLIEPPTPELSFTEAYRRASLEATKLARRSGRRERTDEGEPVGEPPRPEPLTEAQQRAFAEFSRAAAAAVEAGIPFRLMERMLAKESGAKIVEEMSQRAS
jgi:hypothetical protein